ncbi:ABC transporter permease [candidate division KSB1 bacterium]
MFDAEFITSIIRLSTPLILASFGGLFCEKGGIANIALEGKMLIGAFTGAAITYYTSNPWIGLIGACISGLIIAGIHGIICIHFKGDQIISGAAINIFAFGLPQIFCLALFNTPSSSPIINENVPVINIGLLKNIPFIGYIVSQVSVLIWICFLVVIVTCLIFRYTRFGLRLEAAGENPAALDNSGISVTKYRYSGVLICGVLAALAGAYLSIDHGSQFIRNMTAGRGFIALAALILGNWKPGRVLIGCLFFGFMEAIQIRLQGNEIIPVEFIQIIPYLTTIIVLIGFFGKASPPKGLAIPYSMSKKGGQ